MWRKPTLRGRDEGAVAVETAVTLSVLLLLLLGIMQFTVAFYQLNTMQLAVSHAGRSVMLSYATPTTTRCDTSCAENTMKAILTSATVCTTPTSGQTCVNASLKTDNGTNGMTLTAVYGYDLIWYPGTMPLRGGIWVPLN